MNDDIDIATDRDELAEGEARLVIREDDVTHIIQGPSEKVEQRLHDHLDETLGTDGEEIEDYPMPDPLDDEPVDASESSEA